MRLSVLYLLPLAMGCSDLFKVTNPGPTPASSLDDPAAAAGVVSGISRQVSVSFLDAVAQGGVLADELYYTGSDQSYSNQNTGIVTPDDDDHTWSKMQQARWMAEHGITRLQTSLGSLYGKSQLAAQANVLAAFIDRALGESMCKAVIDGGPAQDRSVYFERAEKYFTEALTIESAAGDATYVPAAYGGRASVRAWQGRWDDAVADAQHVPSGATFGAEYSLAASIINNIADGTVITHSFNIYHTPYSADSTDPRTPSGMVSGVNADGSSPVQVQGKYTSDEAPIPFTHWAEMQVLQAEAALRNNDIATALAFMNAERQAAGDPVVPVDSVPADLTTAWALLRHERGAVTWLEGRRLWDLGRWNAATGPEHDSTMDGRATCLPIGRTELNTNPNLSGH
jgi:starch-binding outer membrane protein, SusD/RagB family